MEKSKVKLLREAKTEDLKPGVKVVYRDGDEGEILDGPDKNGRYATKWEMVGFAVILPNNMRLAPMCWVKDKPVYNGTKLFRRLPSNREIVEVVADHVDYDVDGDLLVFKSREHGRSYTDNRYGTMFWERPDETNIFDPPPVDFTAYTLVFKAQTFDNYEDAERRRQELLTQLGGNSAEQIFVGTATWTEPQK